MHAAPAMSAVQTTTREELLLGSIKNALETRNYVDPPVAYRGGVPSTHSLKELLISSSVDMETTTNTTITALCTIDSDPGEIMDCFERLLRFIKEGESVHRSALGQVIFPTFVHIYLDFVSSGHSDVAQSFYNKHCDAMGVAHQSEMKELSEITTAEQLATSQLASKFRSQKYCLRMCSRAFQLLIQFLQVVTVVHKWLVYQARPSLTHVCSSPVLLNLIQQHLTIEVFGSAPPVNGEQKAEQKSKGPQAPTFTKPNIPQLHSDPPPAKKKSSKYADHPPSLSGGGGGTPKFPYSSPGSGPHPSFFGGGIGGFTMATGSVGEAGSEGAPAAGKLKSLQRTASVTAPHPTHLTEFKDKLSLTCQFDPCPPSIALYTVLDGQDGRLGAHCASFSTASKMFSCGFPDSSIHLWSQLPGATTPPTSHHMTSTGHHYHTPSNQPIRLQNSSCSDHCVLLGHYGPVYSTCFDSMGQYMLSASEDTTIRLWHTQRRSSAACYRGHAYPVWDVAFSPVDVYFTSSSYDQTARLWCTDLAFPLRIFAGHTGGVNVVRFHPNGKYIATGSRDHTSRLWDIQNGQCVRLLTGNKGAISCVAFSPSGKQLVSGGGDGLIQLWDIGSGNIVKEFKGHSEVTSLAYSPDGTLLASSCHGNQIRVWNMRTANVLPVASIGASSETDLVSQHVTPGTCVLSLHFTHRNCLVAIATTTQATPTTS